MQQQACSRDKTERQRTNRGMALCLLLLLGPSLAAAQVRIGPIAGFTSCKLGGDSPEGASYGRRSGGSFGLVGDIHLTDDVVLSIQPAYVQRGTVVSYEVEDEAQDSLKLRLEYVDVAVMVKILPDSGSVFFTSGLGLGFLSSATMENVHGDANERDVADSFEDFDLSIAFGVGVRIPVAGTDLDLELRYGQSLLSIANEDVALVAPGMPTRIRSSGLQLTAAWLFPLRR